MRNVIYLTINLKDPETSSLALDITASSLDLKAKSTTTEEEYALHIDFFKEIDESSIRQTITGSHIFLVLVKKDLDEAYWPRLTKDKIKYRNIRTDFDKWVDEDEQDEKPDEALNGMDDLQGFSQDNLDFSALAKQFGGAGDAGSGKSGPSQFGDFSGVTENDFSSSGDEEEEEGDEDEDEDEEGDEEHSHAHTHTHDSEHGASHSHEHGHSHSH